jgi:dTMP kinase
MLITLYGINNIGKSTQANMLVAHLESLGLKAIYLKYPIYDIEPTGPYINKILRSGGAQQISEEELQMWFALNRHQYEPELNNLLDQGYIVIAEDYIATSLAWGSAKGASMDWLEALNSKLRASDLSILIQGERTIQSVEPTHIHENDNQLVSKVSQILSDLAQKHNWPVVQKQAEKEDTQKLILDIVKKALNC